MPTLLVHGYRGDLLLTRAAPLLSILRVAPRPIETRWVKSIFLRATKVCNLLTHL